MTGSSLIKRPATEVGFTDQLPDRPIIVEPDLKVRRLVFWLLTLALFFFGGLGAWAFISPMHSAVVASGEFQVKGKRLVVQHMEGGIVRDIRVANGDVVHKGDVIAVLDQTRARAALNVLRIQLAGALATRARLAAEFIRKDHVPMPDELAAMIREDPSLASIFRAQVDIFQSDMTQLAGQLSIYDDRIEQYRNQKAGISKRRDTLDKQLDLVNDQFEGLHKLYEAGLATKATYINARRDQTSLLGQIQVAESDLQAVLQQIAEMEERKLQVERQMIGKVNDQRQSTEQQIVDIRQRIEAARDILQRLTIRAPGNGKIVSLELNTIGQVIQPGQKVVEIVPSDSPLVVAIRVKTKDIQHVVKGGEARVRLSAYNYRTTPMVKGTVTYVAADSVADGTTGVPYYAAEVTLNAGELRHLKHVEALPGMPATVMVATGEQTLADYLLFPIYGGLEVALSEPD